MDREVERKMIAILKILSREREPMGASYISRALKDFGIELTERAVRYHLKIMDERGLTEGRGKQGRLITQKGREELENALVSDKVGMVITKILNLSYQTTFDIGRREGKIILNISLIPQESLEKALLAMKDVFQAKLCTSDLIAIARSGEKLGEVEIPLGRVGIGTVCSVTIDGILLKQGIPVDSKFGGILQIGKFKPLRFTDLISYEGSSLDPHEIFLKSGMVYVRDAAIRGEGKMLAGFREIAAVSQDRVQVILEQLASIGIYGVLLMGKPSQTVLGIPVGVDRVGMVVAGGLNPIAAVEEMGIPTESKALSTLIDYQQLTSFWNVFEQEERDR
jgi:repressor of nif and glnA expression